MGDRKWGVEIYKITDFHFFIVVNTCHVKCTIVALLSVCSSAMWSCTSRTLILQNRYLSPWDSTLHPPSLSQFCVSLLQKPPGLGSHSTCPSVIGLLHLVWGPRALCCNVWEFPSFLRLGDIPCYSGHFGDACIAPTFWLLKKMLLQTRGY